MNKKNQNTKEVEKMVKAFDEKQLYPLLVQNDFSKIEDFLNQYGLDSVDSDGRTILSTAIVEHKNNFAKKIIDLGADINQQDHLGYSPFLFAVSSSNKELLLEFLNNPKLDKTVQNKYGKNALGIALQAHPNDNELMILLIDSGIDPFMKYFNKVDSPYSIMKEFESGELTIGNNKLNIEPVVQTIEDMYQISKP